MADKNVMDISSEQRKIIEWKEAKRLKLRNEYIKELYDPHRHTAVIDEQILRHSNTRNYIERLYKPNIQKILPAIAVAGVVWFSIEVLNRRRDEREEKYRTGQVKYKDRLYKFTV